MNVATTQVEPVIRSVLLNVVGIEVDALPKSSTLSNMLAEMKCLAYEQLSDELRVEDNITLHSDGPPSLVSTLDLIKYLQKVVCILWACVKC